MALAHRALLCVVRSLLLSSSLRTPSHAAWLPHLALRSIPHGAPFIAALRSTPSPRRACSSSLHTVPRPPRASRSYWGAAKVSLLLLFPTRRSWPP